MQLRSQQEIVSAMIARRLFDIRNQYSASHSAEKLLLLRQLDSATFGRAREIKLLHAALCFVRAFPDSPAHHRLAQAELVRMEQRVDALVGTERRKLRDTGISGTPVYYEFSSEVSTWLAQRAPGTVSIDWDETGDSPDLDAVLALVLEPSEEAYFDSGDVSAKEWVELASTNTGGTDFDWLLAQLKESPPTSTWAELYDAAGLWLTWHLQGVGFSKSLNAYPVKKVCSRQQGFRDTPASVKQEIMRPLESVSHLAPRAGAKMIDVAMASLAVRHRETFHFNHANPREVYVAEVGEGISIAVFGLHKRDRVVLECTMGYLILSNGVPIGYGGASVLFRQVNTGVNIFDEYRGSEAAFLWAQVMRMYHHVTGCTRYIANAYQFGADNDEALKSGAFWFYYRIGYRPVERDIRELASREFAKIRHGKRYRSDLKTLRRLASCDMHLTLPGTRQSDLFEERWLETSSMLATRVLAAAGGRTREDSVNRVAAKLANDLGIRSYESWSSSERSAFKQIAPIAAAAHPENWPAKARKSMRELLRAKGGDFEAEYARRICRHELFLSTLREACRREERD